MNVPESCGDQTTQASLVQAARDGDAQALGALLDCHRPLILAVAWRLTGDRDAAEDVVQEALVRTLRALPGLREAAAFRPWLLRITVRLCLSLPRRMATQAAPLPELTDPDTPESLLLQSERTRLIEAALLRLPPRHRVLLILRDVEDLSYAEMADVLGCSSNAVKVRLSRARELFRQRARGLLCEEVEDA